MMNNEEKVSEMFKRTRDFRVNNYIRNCNNDYIRKEKGHLSLELELEHLEEKLYFYMNKKEFSEKDLEKVTQLEAREKELKNLIKNSCRRNSERISRIKKSYKKMSKDKLFDLIYNEIKNDQNCVYVSKEYFSDKYNVKEHFVEMIFHKLNLKGILSQRESSFVHDCNRDLSPFGGGGDSGWHCDIYTVNRSKLY